MKLRILLVVVALTTMCFSCEPTGPGNTVPELFNIGSQTVTARQTKNVELSATDADGDSLAFSIPTNPGFLSITGLSQVEDTATAILVISPEDTGTFNAIVEVSDGRGGVDNENFTIEVVESALPDTGQWNATADFGGFVFIVNPQSTYITKITYNFSDWTCGSVTLSGSVTISSSPGWSISDGEFTIENNLDLWGNKTMTISGTFSVTGNQASGTWEAVIYGTTCSGTWEGSPVD